MSVANVLIVDDEPDICEMVQEYLEKQGFTVRSASGGEEMWQRLAEDQVHLVLLDVNMPGTDGFTLARELRESHDLGIIMLTSASDVVDKVVGLEIGADDYVTKPFSPRELTARIKTVLRRVTQQAAFAPELEDDVDEVARFGHCRLNLASRKLIGPDGDEITITSMEFDLLKAFADNPNRVLNRDRLLDLAGRRDGDPFDRSIDIRVSRIRRKVEPDPKKPETIKTVHGVGYMYVPPSGA